MTEKEFKDNLAAALKEKERAMKREADPVNHPAHYGGRYETIDVIRDVLEAETDATIGYYIGNVIKYLCRYRKKGEPITDLKKAKKYLEWTIDRMEKLENEKKFRLDDITFRVDDGVYKGGGRC